MKERIVHSFRERTVVESIGVIRFREDEMMHLIPSCTSAGTSRCINVIAASLQKNSVCALLRAVLLSRVQVTLH